MRPQLNSGTLGRRASSAVTADRHIRVLPPLDSPGDPWAAELRAAAASWRSKNGAWPIAFVSDITTATTDARADGLVSAVRDCGFAVHRHDSIDNVHSFFAAFCTIQPRLVVLCARGASDPELVRPFVLAIPDVDYILVAGDQPDSSAEREGDPGSRGYYLDPVADPKHVAWIMKFIFRGLGILPPPTTMDEKR